MAENRPVIVWFRKDLRLSDNPALSAAVKAAGEVIPVFIWAPEEEGDWPPGGASKWWLHKSLESLSADLEAHGASLTLRRGSSLEVLQDLIRQTGAGAVYWNRRYEPAAIECDSKIKKALRDGGVAVESFNSALLFEPWEIQTASKTPFKVYTAFWRACMKKDGIEDPIPAPKKITAPPAKVDSDSLERLELLPKINWYAGIAEQWTPGENGAKEQLRKFVSGRAEAYDEGRNLPAEAGTSRLSAHLHFGELSPREIWFALGPKQKAVPQGVETYRKEIIWREFAYHLLFHFPKTPTEPLRPQFAKFPWKKNKQYFSAWTHGKTGYPIVDAGMRELWHTGWMHNRVRMIVASFLVKHLLIRWQEGAEWFWDTLVDADLANNTLGWQWTAGCGADAAPFFRIFNPTAQGERFDAEGLYVKKWCPELKGLPKKWIHRPWEAPEETLKEAGVELGKSYPEPIVDHAEAREEALEAFEEIGSRKIG